MKKIALTVLALLASAWAQAAPAQQVAPQDEVLRDFLRCDGQFFSTLKQHSAEWSNEASFRSNQKYAWFQVNNRNQGIGNFVNLVPLHELGPLLASAYMDQFYDFGQAGLVYSWGFIVKGSVNEVAEKVRPYLSKPEYFNPVGSIYARTEIKWPKGDWQWTNQLESGVPAGLWHVERVLTIEPSSEGYSSLVCSIQGGVDKTLLSNVRPDIQQ